jgi:hypothetical protein
VRKGEFPGIRDSLENRSRHITIWFRINRDYPLLRNGGPLHHIPLPRQERQRKVIAMNDTRRITREDQACISNCIFEWWGNREDDRDPEDRDRHYERCLTDCRVCG